MTQTRFSPDRVQKFTIAGATDWMEYSGIALADVVNEDEDPAAKLGALGFLRAPAGAASQFQFPYDEVLIVTRGRCTVRNGGREVQAGPGEVVYIPNGQAGSFAAETDLEMVYVASPPYGEANREAKAHLLSEARDRGGRKTAAG
jgi:ethanolamine utilization protein EutQ (cupin superfamily)